MLQFATTPTDLEGIRLSKISQRKRDTYDLTYRLNLKTKAKLIKNTRFLIARDGGRGMEEGSQEAEAFESGLSKQ